jgi:dihydrolipoamide dehydrogenase
MAETQWDVIVVGGGPAGYTAAIRLCQRGLRTLLIERGELGGVCLNRGCIPSKALIHCAHLWAQLKRAEQFGIHIGEAQFDWRRMRAWADRTVMTLRRGLQTLLRHHGVEVLRGEAQPEEPTVVRCVTADGEERQFLARAVVWATGSSPMMLPHAEGACVFTEEEALFWDALPDRLVIIGGGASGVELAWLFNALGVKVTLVEMLPHLLPIIDEEMAKALQGALEKQGVTVRTVTKVTCIEKSPTGAIVVGEDGSQWEADAVVCAVGRRPNSAPLQRLGVAVDKNGAVVVNEWQQTNLPTVFAIGDVVHGSWTAHGGMAEGERVAEAIASWLAKGRLPPMPPAFVLPFACFCEPQVLRVGLTEREAQEQGYAVKVSRFSWRACGAAVAMDETEGFVKVVADEVTGRVLGVHLLGAGVANLSGEAVAIVAQGLTAAQAAAFLRQHPTLSEGIGEAFWALLGLPLHSTHRATGRRA